MILGQKSNTILNKRGLIHLYILLGIIGRLIPHPANVTPMTSLCLFSGAKLSRLSAMIMVFIVMVISDMLLALWFDYPLYGSWMLFSYSGFAAIIGLGYLLGKNPHKTRLLAFVIGSSVGYWLWTNFGVWLCGFDGLYYAHNLSGLLTCYGLALPFLRNSLLGDLVWMVLLFGSFEHISQFVAK